MSWQSRARTFRAPASTAPSSRTRTQAARSSARTGSRWAGWPGLEPPGWRAYASCFLAAQRIFYTELMASYVAHSLSLSPVTLALLQDSGWCGQDPLAGAAGRLPRNFSLAPLPLPAGTLRTTLRPTHSTLPRALASGRAVLSRRSAASQARRSSARAPRRTSTVQRRSHLRAAASARRTASPSRTYRSRPTAVPSRHSSSTLAAARRAVRSPRRTTARRFLPIPTRAAGLRATRLRGRHRWAWSLGAARRAWHQTCSGARCEEGQ